MQSIVAVVLLALCVGLSHAAARTGAETRPKRMVGGRVAENVPWQVLLHYGNTVLDGGIGGGALVSDRWVLTSGRNVFRKKPRLGTKGQPNVFPVVYLGVRNRNPVQGGVQAEVEKVVLHPGFQTSSTWENNLALIKLKSPVTFNNNTLPIPLPEVGQDLEKVGTQGVVAGWGWSTILSFADHLKILSVPVVSQEDCKKEYPKGGEDSPLVDDRTFCTGATQFSENMCVGDEGGAFAVLDPKNNKVYAAGLLSYDKNCQDEKYAVYTKLSAYLPWINSVMREDREEYSALRTAAMHRILAILKGHV